MARCCLPRGDWERRDARNRWNYCTRHSKPSAAKGRRRRRTPKLLRISIIVSCIVASISPFGTVCVSALRCFSCTDCSTGRALSIKMQLCPSDDCFCASVFRQRDDSGGHFSVDRGCASALNLVCTSEGTTTTPSQATIPGVLTADGPNDREGWTAITSSGDQSPSCCSTDLCNGAEHVPQGGHRKSSEHLRNLMEGNPSRKLGRSSIGVRQTDGGNEGVKDRGIDDTEDGNSAHSARVSRGSRFATVLVIVGTFSHVLWLVGSLLQ